MTTTMPPDTPSNPADAIAAAQSSSASLGDVARAYVVKLRGGDVGSLPAILGLVALVIVFSSLRPYSFTNSFNFANLINQSAGVVVLAMGLVFVLLLGEIDLSAGFAGGTGAAVLGWTLTQQGGRWSRRSSPPSPPAWSSAWRSGCWWPSSGSRRSWSPWRPSWRSRVCC